MISSVDFKFRACYALSMISQDMQIAHLVGALKEIERQPVGVSVSRASQIASKALNTLQWAIEHNEAQR